ncbi:choice-of-anchor I family protein [Sphingobium algorifonticola]|uniref:Choice-of-anchor I domain-containing protein n=1 Tax=Sphingobium algorifonticola TaxID=2008318 RepID=A0A437J798_9SPHN|nr:choice-of-anchor I family protein [Sphingobium algorifonticola]RVT40904.1 hypothetical protein ENE74_10600 [Sphingobium algorifonticola]
MGPGSIAFTGYNADGNDDIAFVALEEIPAGTVINFNDREWQGSAFNTGEGEVRFTATNAIAAGTVVTINSYSSSPSSAFGSVSGSSGIGNNAEIIYAFVGAPNTPTAFLAAIANAGFGVDGGTLTGTGLVVGETAIDLGAADTDADIGVFNGARSGATDFADYRTAINDVANWTIQDADGDNSADGVAPDLPFDTTAFTVGSAETQTIGFATDSLSITQAEGNSGTVAYTFTIARTGGTTGDATVSGTFSATATDAADFGGTLPGNFSAVIAAGATSTTVTIEVSGDTLIEGNESFRLNLTDVSNGSVAASINGATATATGVIQNDDVPETPFGGITILDEAESLAGSLTVPVPTGVLEMVRIGSIEGSGTTAAGRAESVAFDPTTDRAFTTNAALNLIDITQVGSDGSLTAVGSIDLNSLPDAGPVNSVAVKNGILAVAYQSQSPDQPGTVALFDAATGDLVQTITVGVLPDQLTFSPDGSRLLVANEAETISASNNPAGGVTIIDTSGGAAAATVLNTITFAALNGSEADLKAAGFNTYPGQSAGAEFEPEYISVSPDGTRAYVTLQEVNGVAVIDLTDPTATQPLSILPLGSIDRSLAGNAFDASDRDGISLENFDVDSLPQPDAIASFSVGGVTYFVTANEGDARVGVADEVRLSAASYVLDPTAYPDAAALKNANALGRLNVISTAGDTDGDGDIDQITTYGGRGISIFRQNADGTIEKVRETGGEFEAIFAAYRPDIFNVENGSAIDDRSDNKGPEPEGVVVGEVDGRLYAFVTLERTGGLMTYDVTDPANATFVGFTPATAADYAPEVLTFVSAADSPTGQAIVLTANEVSGTLTLYSADVADIQSGTEAAETLLGDATRDRLEGLDGADRLRGFDGNDVLVGGGGNDVLEGGAGNDNMQGGEGNDSYFVDSTGDVVIEQTAQGTDTVKTTLLSYTLGANVEVLQFQGGGNAVGVGNGLANTLFGNAGNDTLSGLAGDDRLVGGAGNDVLTGGAGRDVLEGGAGDDRFVFAAADFTPSLLKADIIRDFDVASGDVIDLSALSGLAFIGAAGFSGTAREVRFEQTGASTFVYGDTDGDGDADFAIELAGNLVLTASELVL